MPRRAAARGCHVNCVSTRSSCAAWLGLGFGLGLEHNRSTIRIDLFDGQPDRVCEFDSIHLYLCLYLYLYLYL